MMILVTLGIVVTAVVHVWVRVPFLPTPHAVAERMVRMASLQPGEFVMDLGAGDARLLLSAERAVPSIRAIGYELQPLAWLLGRLRILLRRSKVRLLLRDARTADLRGVDCLFLYLTPELLREFSAKFACELKPGTRILSYAFAMPDLTPVIEEDVPWLTGTRKLRLYRWERLASAAGDRTR